MDGLGIINSDIFLNYIRSTSKERDDLAKKTGSWSGDYDYGKSDMIQASNGHYSDSGKLPWHPTFSTESEYSSPEFRGGTWSRQTEPNDVFDTYGKDVYTPSEDMIKAGTTKGLVDYMQTREPNAILKAPEGYRIEQKDIKPVQTIDNEGLGSIELPIDNMIASKEQKEKWKTVGGPRG